MPLEKKVGYIKSRIPKELWNEAKSESALLGVTMTDFLIHAINHFITYCRKQREKLLKSSMDNE
jgi:hypothetical protein